ncbi:MAG: hypothetical protein O3A01_06730 [bacterium]|nr:hypothetical protein [bacterium]
MEKLRITIGMALLGIMCCAHSGYAVGFYDQTPAYSPFEIELDIGYMSGETLLEYGDVLELADGISEELLPFPNDELKLSFNTLFATIRSTNRLTRNTHLILDLGKTMQSNTGPIEQSVYDDAGEVTTVIASDSERNEVIRVEPKFRYYFINSEYKENGKKQLYMGVGYMYQDIYAFSDEFTQTTGGTSTSVTGNEWVAYHANIQFPYIEVGFARTVWFDTLFDINAAAGAATIVDRWEDGLSSLKTKGNHVGTGGLLNLKLSWELSRHYTAFVNTRFNYVSGIGTGKQTRVTTTGDGPAGEIGDYDSRFQHVDALFTVGFSYQFVDK